MSGCFSKTPAIIEVNGELLESVQRINAHFGIKKWESLLFLNVKFFYLFVHNSLHVVFSSLYFWSTEDTKCSCQSHTHLVIISGLWGRDLRREDKK